MADVGDSEAGFSGRHGPPPPADAAPLGPCARRGMPEATASIRAVRPGTPLHAARFLAVAGG